MHSSIGKMPSSNTIVYSVALFFKAVIHVQYPSYQNGMYYTFSYVWLFT